ncbi:hypothetical protein [Streptomyces sp. NPDC001851]|uniref:hypothetical protein n=1 Tax=Streptomyces sp. NPDC001851 TaxID=3154529 RepID=UPI00332B0975
MRRKTWEWWQSVLQSRLEPDGAICVIQTRWNEDDLAGRILADAQANEWKIIDLPALADSDTDPLGRKIGEPRWPERFDAEHHATTRRRVGERVWAALYQQKPHPPEGGVWQRAWITDHRITTVEFGGLDMARVIVAVDPAGGESAIGDETGIIGAVRGYDGHLYVLEDRSGSMGANDWGRTACLLALALKADAIVVESNYGGDMARQVLSQAWEQLRREAPRTASSRPVSSKSPPRSANACGPNRSPSCTSWPPPTPTARPPRRPRVHRLWPSPGRGCPSTAPPDSRCPYGWRPAAYGS